MIRIVLSKDQLPRSVARSRRGKRKYEISREERTQDSSVPIVIGAQRSAPIPVITISLAAGIDAGAAEYEKYLLSWY